MTKHGLSGFYKHIPIIVLAAVPNGSNPNPLL
jgi:hypothetical protein